MTSWRIGAGGDDAFDVALAQLPVAVRVIEPVQQSVDDAETSPTRTVRRVPAAAVTDRLAEATLPRMFGPGPRCLR